MADITINDLVSQAPTSNDVFPFSTTGVTPATYKASLAQIKSGMSLNNVENKSSATIRGEITSSNVTTALGYTPYNSSNPNNYVTASSLPTSDQLIKAWVKFDGTKNVNGSADLSNTDRFLIKSFNVSRVLRQDRGKYVVYFTSNLPSAHYVVSGTAAKGNNANDGNAMIQALGFNNSSSNAPTAGYFYLNLVQPSNYDGIDVIAAVTVVGG